MKRISKRDKELISVMLDLFAKGNPETRIAKYFFEKKMTLLQVHKFLQKYHLNDVWRLSIYNAFSDVSTGMKDNAQRYGSQLKDMLDVI